MAGYGTKKVGSDAELQLSFPTEFASAYAAARIPTSYFGSVEAEPLNEVSGDDLMARLHKRKREEANRMVMAGVSATKNAINRYLVSSNGYYNLPKPVLSQRKFANPSNGSAGLGGDLNSARRTSPLDAPFHCVERGVSGGVLRSMEGQKYGQMLLQKRIDQLNKIDELKDSGFAISSLPARSGFETAKEVGTPDLVKLSALLSQLVDGLAAGNIREINRFALTDVSDMMTLIFNLMPRLSREQIENIIEALDDAEELSRAIQTDLLNAEIRLGEEETEEIEPPFLDDDEDDDKIAKLRAQIKPLLRVGDKRTKEGRDAIAENRKIEAVNRMAEEFIQNIEEGYQPTEVDKQALERRLEELKSYREKEKSSIHQNTSYVATLITLIPKIREYVDQMYANVDKPEKEKRILSKSLIKSLGLSKYYSLKATKAREYLSIGRPDIFGRKAVDREDEEADLEPPPEAFEAAGRRGGSKAPIKIFRNVRLRSEFEIEPRNVFAERSGSYFGEQKPIDYIAHVNPMRTQTDQRDRQTNELEMARAREAMAPKELVASGKKKVNKNFIQEAVATMKKGAFTKQAKRAHESPLEFAKSVLAKPEKFTKKTEKRAQFLKNIQPKKLKLINGSGKTHRGAYHQMEDGTYMSGAKHTKRSKLLTKA
jgi:hypothetical protein